MDRYHKNSFFSVKKTKYIRVVLFGSGSVGKSSMVKRFVFNEFTNEEELSIMEFYQKQVIIGSDRYIIEVVDHGIELGDVDLITQQHIAGVDGFLLVFAVDDKNSLSALGDFRTKIRELRQRSSDLNLILDEKFYYSVPMIVVANKIDLVTDFKLSPDLVEEAQSFGIPCVETSAVTGQGIQEAFLTIIREVQKMTGKHGQSSVKRKKGNRIPLFKHKSPKNCSIM